MRAGRRVWTLVATILLVGAVAVTLRWEPLSGWSALAALGVGTVAALIKGTADAPGNGRLMLSIALLIGSGHLLRPLLYGPARAASIPVRVQFLALATLALVGALTLLRMYARRATADERSPVS